ncbi:Uncharacterised protein [Zhongshania aliphaticivorans]|uniref:Uncharacterized protein n=1 Tax=Zhongshania aliphaticivorans TaxID=1470434 RepID=A0A5S9MUI9_9GAMM|nr:Uncharacterised protein [Zhongshania aliphaticivorans]CAA0085610.1 Uncharacterised protein [Zhongshania aliphaticivorans]
MEPIDSLTITVDAYQIDIEDRIVLSGGLTSALGDANLTAALAAAGASSAQFFLNGTDTETRGIDIVSTYMMAAEENAGKSRPMPARRSPRKHKSITN